MSGSAGRRRSRSEGSRRITPGRRNGGLVRWQAARRGAGGARLGLWTAGSLAAVVLALSLIAARVAGGLHWESLLMLIPAGVLVAVLGAALVAVVRRAVIWLAG